MARRKILIADDEVHLVKTLLNIFVSEGYNVKECTEAQQFFNIVYEYQPDVILLDIYFEDENGIDFLRKLKENGIHIPVIMITAYSDVTIAVEAMKEGAEDFVVKPFDLTHLRIVVEKALEQSTLQNKIAILQEELKQQRADTGIVGKSSTFVDVLQTADRITQSESTTVLIEGESGTGKELLAKYIYQKSLRADKPFVTLNCAAIPRELAESEFFGYERGAFTGATEKMKKGKFELADGGIIFLDEIGELSLDMQVKLLRLIEEKRFYRLGGTQEITVDVWVIAATNKNLHQEVEDGRFREDLYYRLNVATLYLPPLRDRKEDIEPLTYAFVNEYGNKFKKNVSAVSPDVINYFKQLSWRGNVRELRNAIERAVLLNDEEELRREHFAFLRNGKNNVPLINAIDDNVFVLKIPETGIKINDVIRDLILKTLTITDGNQVQAAKILGLTRSKLRYRMEQLGIQPEQKGYLVRQEESIE